MESPSPSRRFEVLFDNAEPSSFGDDVYAPYGNFGFPPPPPDRPWIYANFVQSLDGITTLLGEHGSGGEISQSPEDRWLMDLLRAHADGLLMGMNTLLEEQRSRGPQSRGIVFQVADPKLRAAARPSGKSTRAQHLRDPRSQSRSVAAQSFRWRRGGRGDTHFSGRSGTIARAGFSSACNRHGRR